MARRSRKHQTLDENMEAAESKAPEEITKPKAKKRTTYFCVRASLVHPFQHIRIPTHPPGVQLDRDSWLKVQMDAGLVRAYKE